MMQPVPDSEINGCRCKNSAVAQLVERLAVNEDVLGPSPSRGAKFEKHPHRGDFFILLFS